MACRLVGLSRSAYRRPLKGDTVADPDRALREWLRAWAKDHPRSVSYTHLTLPTKRIV